MVITGVASEWKMYRLLIIVNIFHWINKDQQGFWYSDPHKVLSTFFWMSKILERDAEWPHSIRSYMVCGTETMQSNMTLSTYSICMWLKITNIYLNNIILFRRLNNNIFLNKMFYYTSITSNDTNDINIDLSL